MKTLFAVLGSLLLPLCLCAQQNWKAVMRYDKQDAKTKLAEHLSEYVTYDTQASSQTDQIPSTKGQLSFAKALAKELKRIGAQNVQTSKQGVVTAEIPATTAKPTPVIALMASLDTAETLSGKDIKPQTHEKYRGGDIVIDKENNLRLSEYNSPQLLQARGHDIMTASGSTLLGAESKAGIAIIMTLADYLLGNPSIEHGRIKIVFSPDSTTHRGIAALDIPALGADYAYSVAGANTGEIITENFSGRCFTAVFHGKRDVPAGQAMQSDFADNLLMASDFHTLLPRQRRPENTSARRGFILVDSINTMADTSTVTGIIRAFNDEEMQELSNLVQQSFTTAKSLNPKNKGAELTFQDQFKNAQAFIPASVIQTLENAMRQEDIQPKQIALRGRNDATFLSAHQLPTVNVFAGTFNPASQLEYADIDVMEASLRTLISTAVNWTGQNKDQ